MFLWLETLKSPRIAGTIEQTIESELCSSISIQLVQLPTTLTFIFDIFKIISIKNTLEYILHNYLLVQYSAISASFFILSVSSGFVICLSNVSKYNISAAETGLINNHEIITLASFLKLIFAITIVDYWMMTILNYTYTQLMCIFPSSVTGRGKKKEQWSLGQSQSPGSVPGF